MSAARYLLFCMPERSVTARRCLALGAAADPAVMPKSGQAPLHAYAQVNEVIRREGLFMPNRKQRTRLRMANRPRSPELWLISSYAGSSFCLSSRENDAIVTSGHVAIVLLPTRFLGVNGVLVP